MFASPLHRPPPGDATGSFLAFHFVRPKGPQIFFTFKLITYYLFMHPPNSRGTSATLTLEADQ